MLKEFLKFRKSKFISAFFSGLLLGLVFSLVKHGCPSCSRQSLFANLVHFSIFFGAIFVIVWIAHSFTISLNKK
jgi:hypothetical protein